MADFQGTYSADKVIITVGTTVLSGFADGDFVTAAYAEDRATPKSGADGGVGVSRNASKLGTIVVTLSATSAANDALSTIFNLDAVTGKSTVVPIGVADLSGRTLIAGANCWLQVAPEATFGKEIGDREWTFGVADLVMFLGGNG
jgi:hypothetical protein